MKHDRTAMFTEPEDISPDTLANLGPLRPLAGQTVHASDSRLATVRHQSNANAAGDSLILQREGELVASLVPGARFRVEWTP